jgi:hypothetical protein
MAAVSPKLAPAREPTSSAEIASYPPARRRGVYGEGDAASGGGRRVRLPRARAAGAHAADAARLHYFSWRRAP